MDALATKAQKLQDERIGLKKFRDEHLKDGVLVFTDDERTRADTWLKTIGELNDEVKSLTEQKAVDDELTSGIKAFKQPSGGMIFPTGDETEGGRQALVPSGIKSLGELFVEGPLKAWKEAGSPKLGGPASVFDLEKLYGKRVASLGLKALFDTTSWTPQQIRLPTPVLQTFQVPTIADMFPQGRTGQNSIPFMVEDTATSGADIVEESGEKMESELALHEESFPVKKIGTSLPVTTEALEDDATAESYIDSRLSLFVRMAEDDKLLNGSGANTIVGLYNFPGTGTLGQGADTILDYLFKMGNKVLIDSFFPATDLIIHPTDWEVIRLAKDQNDQYLMGPATSNADVRPWGLKVTTTQRALAGHPIVLNPAVAGQIFRRSDVAISVGFIDDQFTHNQRTILAEERLAFVIFRPAAIVKGDVTS